MPRGCRVRIGEARLELFCCALQGAGEEVAVAAHDERPAVRVADEGGDLGACQASALCASAELSIRQSVAPTLCCTAAQHFASQEKRARRKLGPSLLALFQADFS
jgi:hypothetical protein